MSDSWLSREEIENRLAQGGITSIIKAFGRGPAAVLSAVGSIASIVSLAFGWIPAQYVNILYCLIVLSVIILSLGFYHFYKQKQDIENLLFQQVKEYELLLRSFPHIHQLSHELRDNLTHEELSRTMESNEAHKNHWRQTAVQILNTCATIISEATGATCYANVMTLSNDDQDNLISQWWSQNTPPNRKNKTPLTKIPIGLGVAGRAFQEGEVKVIDDVQQCEEFILVSGKKELPYRSLICCPFKIEGVPLGVLNIDCEKPNIFRPEDIRFLVQSTADLFALVVQFQSHEAILLQQLKQ